VRTRKRRCGSVGAGAEAWKRERGSGGGVRKRRRGNVGAEAWKRSVAQDQSRCGG
jgi:hypothetical protein